MPKYIASQPAITLCIESRSSRLPTTTSAPMSRNTCARSSSFRTIARTALPCFNSSSVTVRPTAPTRPAAPVTRMGFAMFFPSMRLPKSKVRFVACERQPAESLSPYDVTFDNFCEARRLLGHLTGRSLGHHNERLPFFDDIRGEFRPVAAADVLCCVDRSGRDEQDLAGLERHRRLALDLILQGAFDDIDDLFARMTVLTERHPGGEIDAHLDVLASGDAQIVPLEIGALNSRLLRPRHVQRQTACGDQRRYRDDSSRHFHVDLLTVVVLVLMTKAFFHYQRPK